MWRQANLPSSWRRISLLVVLPVPLQSAEGKKSRKPIAGPVGFLHVVLVRRKIGLWTDSTDGSALHTELHD